jgi:thiosulfate/3-mercaptopyruvate sulfurtransferase
MQNKQPIISAQDALSFKGKANVIFIDARGGMDAKARYMKNHLDGAIFTDLEEELSQKTSSPSIGGRHPLPEPKRFGKLLGDLGIDPSTQVLVYDDKKGANAAARFWWMLRAAGHTNVHVIDGGLDSLISAGAPLNNKVSDHQRTSPYPFETWTLPKVDISFVEKAANDSDFLVIDVREAYRFQGESEPIDLVAGHIPGAVNMPYLNNLDSAGNFLPSKKLADQYKAAFGNRSLDKVIVHCGSGVTACHTLLALEQAGLPGANLYVGSWSEWSRTNRPMARGAE